MKAWESDDSADWIGKRVTLYCDEKVTFGKDAVGGIRVSHVSGISKPKTVKVTATRGRRMSVTVQPLADAPPPTDWHGLIQAAGDDVDALRAMWQDASSKGADQTVLDAIKDAATAAGKDAA